MIVKTFDFGHTTCPKEKEDGVGNRGGRKQVTKVGSTVNKAEKVVSVVVPGRGTNDSCDSNKRGNSRGSRENNTKLLNHKSDFWGDKAIGLKDFHGKSDSDGSLKWVWTIGSNIPIVLTVAILDYRSKFEKLTFNAFIFCVIFNAFVFGVLNIMPK